MHFFGTTLFAIIVPNDVETLVVPLIANVLSFLTSFIVIPKLIVDYLFNKEEDTNLVGIIKTIQEHDKDLRAGRKDKKEEIRQEPPEGNTQGNIQKIMQENTQEKFKEAMRKIIEEDTEEEKIIK